jgi:hypothetical protein
VRFIALDAKANSPRQTFDKHWHGLNTSERVGARYNHQKMRDKPLNVFWRDISCEQPTLSNWPRHLYGAGIKLVDGYS